MTNIVSSTLSFINNNFVPALKNALHADNAIEVPFSRLLTAEQRDLLLKEAEKIIPYPGSAPYDIWFRISYYKDPNPSYDSSDDQYDIDDSGWTVTVSVNDYWVLDEFKEFSHWLSPEEAANNILANFFRKLERLAKEQPQQ